MTSEIRTNTITSRAGLSTVTFTDSGPMFSGITTFVDNSGFNLGTGSSIFTPASNTLTFGTNSNERIRITSSGDFGIGTNSPDRKLDVSGTGNVYGKFQSTNTTGAGIEVKDASEDWLIQADGGSVDGLAFYDLGRTSYRFVMGNAGQFGVGSASGRYGTSGQVLTSGGASGAVSWTTVSGTTINNNANNRVITGSGTANTLEGESALTYSGNIFKNEVSDASGLTAHILVNNSESSAGVSLLGSGSSFSSGGWAPVTDAGIIRSSAGAANGLVLQASAGDMRFYVDGSPTERLRITDGGNLMLRSSSANYLVMGSSGDSGFGATISNNMNWIRGNQDNLQMNCATGGFVSFEVGGSEKLRITTGGQLNLGGTSTQTTHLLHLQGTGDAGIHIRADSDNSGENDNPYLSMSQDGSSAQELKIGQNGDAGQNFALSLANSPFIHANHSAAYPLQLAHMNTMCVFISSRHNELGLNNYSGNTTAGMEIQNRGNDTATALKLTGHNNSGTPGVETFTQLTHIGSNLTFEIMHAGSRALHIGSTRRIDVPAVYGTAISSPMRDLYVESTGQLGYQPSIRASKINIADNNDVSWLYDLAPKTYNNRKRVSKDTNEWTDEAEPDLQYGLIAEEVESVKSNICFYDVDDSNNKTLAGVTYSQLITPLLKALQEQKAEIDALKTKVETLEQDNIALRARVTNLEGN